MEGFQGRKFFACGPTGFPARRRRRRALDFSGIFDKMSSSGVV